MANCIRGCATPHDCEACIAGKHEHEPRPVPVNPDGGGLLCERCEKRLLAMLHDIQREELLLLADEEALEPIHTGVREGSFRSKGAMGSPALIRLDVLTLIGQGGSGMDETGLGSITTILGGLAAELRDFVQGLSPDDSPDDWEPWELWLIGRFGDLVRFNVPDLVRAEDDVVHGVDVRYAFDIVAQVHKHVMRAAGATSGAKPLGRCLSTWQRVMVVPGVAPKQVECGATVWARPGETQVRCRRCGRIYSGIDKLRLRHQQPKPTS